MSITSFINRMKTRHQMRRVEHLRDGRDETTFRRQLAEEEINLQREKKTMYSRVQEARGIRNERFVNTSKKAFRAGKAILKAAKASGVRAQKAGEKKNTVFDTERKDLKGLYGK